MKDTEFDLGAIAAELRRQQRARFLNAAIAGLLIGGTLLLSATWYALLNWVL